MGDEEMLYFLEQQIQSLYEETDPNRQGEMIYEVLETIGELVAMQVPMDVPVELEQDIVDEFDLDSLAGGDSIELQGGRFAFRTLSDEQGETLAMFTSKEKLSDAPDTFTTQIPIDEMFENVFFFPTCSGIVINPFTEHSFHMKKDDVEKVFRGNSRVHRNYHHVDLAEGTYDITTMEVDAIVNAAKESLLGGGGVDGAIHRAAGPKLLKECEKLGGCKPGQAKITDGYELPARYVIHTVGPVYDSKSDADCAYTLRDCYLNSLELAMQNGLHSIAFPSISTGVFGYPLEKAAEIAILSVTDWLSCHPYYEMDVHLVCHGDHAKEVYEKVWDKLISDDYPIDMPWAPHFGDALEFDEYYGDLLEKAIATATKLHEGQKRKGTTTPYIEHPLAVMDILNQIGEDAPLLAAGVLHDTVEDTDYSITQLLKDFGPDVAIIVASHTEDKSRTWFERKLRAITDLSQANRSEALLILADKLSNMTDLYKDYIKEGDTAFDKFNAPKHMICWYYSKMLDALYPFAFKDDTGDFYERLRSMYKEIFMTFLYDKKTETLYSLDQDGTEKYIKKNKPGWFDLLSKPPQDAVELSREDAERLMTQWRAPLFHRIQEDATMMESGPSSLTFPTADVTITYGIEDGLLTFVLDDNRTIVLDSKECTRFLEVLHLRKGIEGELSDQLEKEFDSTDPILKLLEFFEDEHIKYDIKINYDK